MNGITIDIQGIKGLSGTYELGPRTVLTGPMGAGKSGILAALHLVLLGKVPALGMGPGGTQTPTALRAICDDGAEVRLTMPDGGIIGRRVEYTPKSARAVPLAKVSGITVDGDKAQEIIDGYQPDLLFADFGLFVKGTARERKEMLLQYFPGLEGPVGQRWMQCEAFAGIHEIIGKGADDPGKVKHGRDNLRAYHAGAVRAIDDDHAVIDILLADDQAMQDKIESLHEGAKAAENDRRARVKAVEGIASIDKSEVQERAGELVALQERMEELDKEWARLEQQEQAAEKAGERRERLTTKIETLKGIIEERTASILDDAGLQGLTKELARARGACIAHDATKPAASNRADLNRIDRDLSEVNRQIDRVISEAKQKRADFDSAKADQEKHAEATGNCPTCNQPWADALAAAKQAAAEASARKNLALADAKVLHETLTTKRAEAEALTAQRDVLRKQDEGRDAEVDAWRTERDRLDGIASGLEEKIAGQDTHKANLADARQRLADAESDLAEIPDAAQVDEEYKEALAGQRTDLAEKVSGAQQAQAKLDLLAGADLDGAQREADIWKVAHQYAVAGRNAFLQSRMSKTCGIVDEAVKGLGIGDKFVLDVTGKSIEIGVDRGGKVIALEALSSGQQVLFAAAMLSGLPRPTEGFRLLTSEGIEAHSETGAFLEWLHATDNDMVIVATQARGEWEGWGVVEVAQ